MRFLSQKFLSAIAMIAVVSFSSCGGGVDRAKADAVANAFLKSSYALDFKAADALASGSAASMLDLKATGETADEKTEREALGKALKPATCKEDGDNATCTFCCGADGKDSPNVLKLSKKDNKWTVVGFEIDQSRPEVVALVFMQYIAKTNFEKAAKLADKNVQPLISMAGSQQKEMQAKETAEEKAERLKKIKNLKSATCEVNGDKATCKLCCDLGADSESIDLVKQDGKWLITIDKEKKEAKMKSDMEKSMNDVNMENPDSTATVTE
jgi:hypothetical protein